MINLLKLSLGIIFFPTRTLLMIKNFRDKISPLPFFILLAATFFVRIFTLFVIHFPLRMIEPRNTNLVIELLIILLPIITYVVASFAITSISSGEARFSEIAIGSIFALFPYIIFSIPLTLFSYLISGDEAGLYAILNMIVLLWVLLLIILSVKVLHDYTLIKTVRVMILTLLLMLLIWILLLLIYALTGNLFAFFIGIFRETVTRLRSSLPLSAGVILC